MDYKAARKVLIYTLLLNWGVSLSKLIYGIMTKSESMTADGYHSFADGANNIAGLIGFFIASRPVDKSHPYGHEKFETITALGIGGILFLVAFNIIREAVQRLSHPVIPEVNLGSFIVMIITIAVNVFVMLYENREGKRLKSQFLVSDSYHTRSDIFVSLSVIVTLFAVRLGMPILDTFVAGIIAIFIGYAAFEIVWETSKVLSDAAMVDSTIIRKAVLNFSDVMDCHNIRTRGKEGDVCVDLHIWVKPTMHVERSHQLAHEIEEHIKTEIPGIKEVIAHIEPASK